MQARDIVMFFVALASGGLLAFILVWFLRRIARIQQERWGAPK